MTASGKDESRGSLSGHHHGESSGVVHSYDMWNVEYDRNSSYSELRVLWFLYLVLAYWYWSLVCIDEVGVGESVALKGKKSMERRQLNLKECRIRTQ